MRKGDLVYLRWEDSLGCPRGWEPLNEAKNAVPSIIESVGWVVVCGRRAVQIAPHVASHKGGSPCVQGHITIPRSGLLSVEVLRPFPMSN